jgi:hypothetical protein
MQCGDISFSLKSADDGLRLFVTGWVPGGFSTLVTPEDLRGLGMWFEAVANQQILKTEKKE